MADEIDGPVEAALAAVRASPQDPHAWSDFYRQFRPRVAALLYVRGARENLADLTQEVFYSFLKASPWRTDWTTLPNSRVVSAYLRTTAERAFVTLRRRQSRSQEVDLTNLPVEVEGVATEDLEEVLDRSAAQLSQEDRRLLEMLIRGNSLEAIASEYHISYSAAGTRVSRLKQKIKKILRSR